MGQEVEQEKQKPTPQEHNEPVLISPKEQYEQIIESNRFEISDPIITKLISSINDGFGNLKPPLKEQVINHLKDFFIVLREYKDSYDGLKYAAKKERGVFFQDDVRRWQKSNENADKREKILHDRFLDSANILARIMKSAGLDNTWRGDDLIYNHGGVNDSTDEVARNKVRQWMLRIYHEKFNSDNMPSDL